MIAIRKFSMLDAKFAYKLINHPKLKRWTRKRSISQILEDLSSQNYILKYGNNRVGMLRLYKNEISLLILPQYQNRGIGTVAINFLKKNNNVLEATIDRYNEKSIRFFEKQGFRIKQVTWIEQEMIWKKH